jgi:hypothetical protein
VAHTGGKTELCAGFLNEKNFEGKSPISRSRHRWEDKIKSIYILERWDEMKCRSFTWLRTRDKWLTDVENTAELWIPQNIGDFLPN